MQEWIVRTFEDDMIIKADTCEVIGDKLVFTLGGEVEGVFAEWVFCSRCREMLRVVKR